MTKPAITQPPAADKSLDARLRGISVTTALLASTALSGFGVGSAFWDGLTSGQAAAWIGLATIGGAIGASEIAAVVLAMSITKDGLTMARSALFGLCTISNVLAGHYGSEAINTRLVAPQRAPYETRLSDANAAVGAAQNTLDAFESRSGTERAELERALQAEATTNPNAITARGRDAQRQRTAISTRQQAERAPIQQDLTVAKRDQATAVAAMREAPQGFSEAQLIGFAVLLEMLKGVLVWATAPRRRKIQQAGMVDISGLTAMDDAELQAAWDSLERARSASSTIWHEIRRRNRRAGIGGK